MVFRRAIDHDAVITVESERLVTVLETADPSASVPAAPEWTADDLLWHIAEVQLFWAAIVAERLREPDPAGARLPPRPAARSDLVALARRGTRELVEALAGADDHTAVWTWSDDATVGFVRRRQMHEVVVHRVDAEQTAGLPYTSVDDEVASDGVEELLEVYASGAPAWMTFTPDGAHVTVGIDGSDQRWTFAFGRVVGTSPDTGVTHDLPALMPAGPVESDATVIGPGAPMLLWLWGRGPVDPLTVTGDRSVADRLRSVIADATR
jgi:uncharacterized protein (TIGR03083 family)